MDFNVYKFIDGYLCFGVMDVLFQCLIENNFDSSKCGEYFKVYKECKKQWLKEKRREKKLDLFGY